MLSLTAHKPPRIKAGDLLGKRPAVEPAASEPVQVELNPEPASVFDRFTQQNPAFALLVDALDLEETSSTVVVSQPISTLNNNSPSVVSEQGATDTDPPIQAKAPFNAKTAGLSLKQLAELAYEPSNSYSEAEAIDRLAELTSVASDRARNGIKLMLTQGILSQTKTNTYYLAESLPF